MHNLPLGQDIMSALYLENGQHLTCKRQLIAAPDNGHFVMSVS